MNRQRCRNLFIILMLFNFILHSLSSSAADTGYQYNGMWSIGPSTGGGFKNLRGVSADITYKGKPVVKKQSMSSIWVMLTTTRTPALAQVGYALDLTQRTTIYYFMGIINNSGDYREYVIPGRPAINSTHNYKMVTSKGTKGRLFAKGYVDGKCYFSTVIDFIPNSVQYQVEISDPYAYFMGRKTKHERISKVLALDYKTWVTPMPKWELSKYGGLNKTFWTKSHYFEVWDKRY